MHLDDERVQRLLHGELEPGADRLVREHLAGCEDCRARVEQAREEERRIFGLLGRVDHQAPEVHPEVVIPRGGGVGSRWKRWAAGVALVTAAAGVAYAAPGSPLPGVLQRVFGGVAPSQSRPSGEAATPGAGIAVMPGDRLTIRFLLAESGTVATVALTDGVEASVRAVNGTATFTSDEDLLSVRSAGPASFTILIPRDAPSVEVLSGNVPILRKRGTDLITDAVPDAEGRYTLSLPPLR
jgi:hypothetical protein